MSKKIKLEPFIAPHSLEPVTPEELLRRQKCEEKLNEIGVYPSIIDDNIEYENPYRAEAACMILRGEDVPEELKEKIKKHDKRMKKYDIV